MPNQNPWARSGIDRRPAGSSGEFRGSFVNRHFPKPPVVSEPAPPANPLRSDELALRDALREAFVNGYITATENQLQESRRVVSEDTYDRILNQFRHAAAEIAKANY